MYNFGLQSVVIIISDSNSFLTKNKNNTCTIGEKVLYHSVFSLFPLTYMCVDIDFRFYGDEKAEKIPLCQEKKIYVVVITFFFF